MNINMDTITIPKTELQVSTICFGTSKLGTIISPSDSFLLLDEYCKNIGGNFIDTANCYSDWFDGEKSASEKIIGRWLKGINRHQVIISTKGGYPEINNKNISRLTEKDIEKDLYNSLCNLGTDYIDIYWLHRDSLEFPVSHFIDLLNKFQRKGLIRYFACSNWTSRRIAEAQNYASQNNLNCFIANQMLWNVGEINHKVLNDDQLVIMNDELFSYHKTSSLIAIPYSTQANGFFGGKYNWILDNSQPIDRLYEKIYYGKTTFDLYNNEENLRTLKNVIKISREHGITQTQTILLGLMCSEFPTIPIVGCRTIEQLKDSCKTSDVFSKLDNTNPFKMLNKFCGCK